MEEFKKIESKIISASIALHTAISHVDIEEFEHRYDAQLQVMSPTLKKAKNYSVVYMCSSSYFPIHCTKIKNMHRRPSWGSVYSKPSLVILSECIARTSL